MTEGVHHDEARLIYEYLNEHPATIFTLHGDKPDLKLVMRDPKSQSGPQYRIRVALSYDDGYDMSNLLQLRFAAKHDKTGKCPVGLCEHDSTTAGMNIEHNITGLPVRFIAGIKKYGFLIVDINKNKDLKDPLRFKKFSIQEFIYEGQPVKIKKPVSIQESTPAVVATAPAPASKMRKISLCSSSESEGPNEPANSPASSSNELDNNEKAIYMSGKRDQVKRSRPENSTPDKEAQTSDFNKRAKAYTDNLNKEAESKAAKKAEIEAIESKKVVELEKQTTRTDGRFFINEEDFQLAVREKAAELYIEQDDNIRKMALDRAVIENKDLALQIAKAEIEPIYIKLEEDDRQQAKIDLKAAIDREVAKAVEESTVKIMTLRSEEIMSNPVYYTRLYRDMSRELSTKQDIINMAVERVARQKIVDESYVPNYAKELSKSSLADSIESVRRKRTLTVFEPHSVQEKQNDDDDKNDRSQKRNNSNCDPEEPSFL